MAETTLSSTRAQDASPVESKLLAALRHARWDDGSAVVDASDNALTTRVLPHLTAALYELAARPSTGDAR